jgi:large subunit ribosomal protein L7/L12
MRLRRGALTLFTPLPAPKLLEAAELVKQIEETFGVDASAPAGGGMMMMAGPAGGAAEAEEAQTEFNLIITDCAADKRIAAIKVVRSLTSLGLKEAKDAVTALPFTILEAKSKADVDKAKADLEAAGCKTEIK